MIKSTYQKFFVALYGWSRKVDGEAGVVNVYYAVLMLSFTWILNLASALMTLEMILGWPLASFFATVSEMWLAAFALALIALQFAYFRQGDRYQAIIKTESASSKTLIAARRRWALGYMMMSFLVFAVLLFVQLKLSK